MTFSVLSALRRGDIRPADQDLEAGRGVLNNARTQPGQPVGASNNASGTPSGRQSASMIGGALENLSGFGRSMGSMAGQLASPVTRLMGRNTQPGHILPVSRQDVELRSLNSAGEEREGLMPEDDNSRYKKMEDKLNQEVLADTFNWTKAGKHLGKTVARAGAAGAGIYGSYMLVDTLIQSKVPEAQQATSRGFVAMGLLAPMYNESKELINGVRESFTNEAKLSYAEALEKTHKRRQQESAARLKTLPKDIRDACTKIDLALQQAFAAARRGDKVKFALIRGMMHWRQDFLLERPMKPREVEALKTEGSRAAMMSNMDALMHHYEPGLQDKLSGFALGIGARSLEHDLPDSMRAPADFSVTKLGRDDDWHQWKEVPKVPKQMMMLAGQPGTGKTHFVEKILPELLGLPVAPLVVPDKQAGGINSLMGAEWSALEQEEYVTADTSLLGKIGLKLIRAACTNPILFLDEADLDDMDGIKRLTDPSRDELEAVALETVLNFRDVTIMLGVNAMKKAQGAPEDGGVGELDTALMDRLELALLNSTSRDSKMESAVKAYHGWAGLYCLPIKGQDSAILNPEQQQRLQQLFKGSLDNLVNYHHDIAGIPGARMAVSVASVTNFIACRLLQEQHNGAEPLTQEKVDSYIAELYGPRIPKQKRSEMEANAAAAAAAAAAEEAAQDAITDDILDSYFEGDPFHVDAGDTLEAAQARVRAAEAQGQVPNPLDLAWVRRG